MVRASRTKSNRVTSEDNLKAVKHADRQQSMHLKQKSNYFGKSFETVKHTDKTDRQDRKTDRKTDRAIWKRAIKQHIRMKTL